MIQLIKKLLLQVVDNIEAGNSNINESEQLEVLDYLLKITNKEERLSKYQACEYLNVGRATFDNLVKEGKIPRGKKQAGFKELFWCIKDLDEYINKYNYEKKNR